MTSAGAECEGVRANDPAGSRARRVAVLLLVLAGCPTSRAKPTTTVDTVAAADDEATRSARLIAELQDDILTSYERDDPPEIESTMIDAKIGTARIGAGPGDVYIAGDLARAPSRWPLDVDRSLGTDVRSKDLQIRLALDQTAAWMSDEVSWRIEMCGRTAVIPLRITALYAHDGDRWVPVFEHLSFAWTPTPSEILPKAIKSEVISGDLKDELSGIVGRALLHTPHDPSVVAQDPAALVLGPDIADEWHGPAVLDAKLPPGRLEDRRVGVVGLPNVRPTIAYWLGNYVADVPARPGFAPAGKVRMRVTFVFEQRRSVAKEHRSGQDSCAVDTSDCHWLLVQTHMSQPITDDELTARVFGTALISPKPLQVDCSDGSQVRVPAAGPRSGVPPARHIP